MVAGERTTIQLGDERDGATPQAVERKLTDTLDDIRLGRWTPDEAKPSQVAAPAREPGLDITLAFEADYSAPYVIQQVGHVDPRTTMRIYSTVCARRDRAERGAAFDRLLAEPRREAVQSATPREARPRRDVGLAVAA